MPRDITLSPAYSRFVALSRITDQITDPVKFRRLNGYATLFWIVMIPASILLGLMSSVAYVAFLSLYALFATHLGAWAASRTEARQVEEAEVDAKHASIRTEQADIDVVNASADVV